jgi:hypothetical protein
VTRRQLVHDVTTEIPAGPARSRVNVRAPIGALTAAAVVILVTLNPVSALAQSPPSTTPDCSRTPLPKGCVTRIQYLTPSSVTAQRHADSGGISVSGTWTLSSDGPSETLPAPMPASQVAPIAAAHARANASSIAPLDLRSTSGPRTTSAARATARAGRTNAKASAFAGVCTYSGTVTMVDINGFTYHMHANSSLSCFNVDTFEVDTALHRDAFPIAFDYANGILSGGINADAWTACHSAGIHAWVNNSDYHATQGGVFFQGPAGPIASEGHRCF